MTPDENNNRALGVREGAKSIGEFMGTPEKPVPPRRVLYLAEQGRIRTFHNGRVLCATEASLREDIAALQQNGAPSQPEAREPAPGPDARQPVPSWREPVEPGLVEDEGYVEPSGGSA